MLSSRGAIQFLRLRTTALLAVFARRRLGGRDGFLAEFANTNEGVVAQFSEHDGRPDDASAGTMHAERNMAEVEQIVRYGPGIAQKLQQAVGNALV